MNKITLQPHSEKQEIAIFSEKRIKIVATGIQWGKTKSSAMFLKMLIHRHCDPKYNFIIAAPNYKIMQQATLPEFLKIMAGWGEWRKGDAEFKVHNGPTVYCRTATDPDSVVGITNVMGIIGDEAGLFPLYFHENLQARASFMEAPIMYATSPYSLNWIYTDYLRPRSKDPNFMIDDLEIVQARSNENPYFPAKEYDLKKKTMDPRRFNMVYGGEFNKVEGLVYDCFDDEIHVIPPQDVPRGTLFIAGVDWGFTNPAVMLVFAVTPKDGVWLVAEWYHTQKTINEMVESAKGLKKVYGIERFYCDPSSPANIQEFNKARLTAIPADNDIRAGIDATYEMIQSDKFHVWQGRCANFLDEISIYHYPNIPDIAPDKDVKEQMPVKQYDHACLGEFETVRTSQGDVPISEVEVGDYVLTPFGYRKVLEAGCTGIKDTYEFVFKGRSLTMTADHRCLDGTTFRWINGMQCDTFLLCDLRVINIILTGAIGGALVIKDRLQSIFTGLFGRSITERCLTGITSIIKTMIPTTMRLATSNAYQDISTFHITANKHQKSYLKKHWIKLLNGIDQKKVENGTVNTGNTVGSSREKSKRTASNAGHHLKLKATTSDSARMLVSRSIEGLVALTTSLERVPLVGKVSKSINMHGLKRVQPLAVNPTGKNKVFNIKVEGTASYYANGILVSNCDAVRYVCLALKRTKNLQKTGPKSADMRGLDLRHHIADELLKQRVEVEEYDW